MLLIRLRNMLLILASRGLFVGHSMVTIWKAATFLLKSYCWGFLAFDLLIVAEAVVVIVKNRRIGIDWLCLSALLYILGTSPAIWLLQLYDLTVLKREQTTYNSSVKAFKTEVFAGGSDWTPALKQVFLLVLIVGRWIMPKGNMNRSALSQILFVYLAIGSDIVSISVLFREPSIQQNVPMHYVIMFVWTISLFQFVLTISNKRDYTNIVLDPDNPEPVQEEPAKPTKMRCKICKIPEMWNLLSHLVLMDGPFFLVRAYVIFKFSIVSYSVVFFLTKNFIMILLILYRFVVMYNYVKLGRKLNEEAETALKSLRRSICEEPQSVSKTPSAVKI